MRILPVQDLRRVAPLLAVGLLAEIDAVLAVVLMVGASAEEATVVVGEGVGLLAVDGVVADLEHLVGHAQRDAAYKLDEDHDERRPHEVPADDEQRADDLQPNLLAVAGDGAAGVADAEGGAAFGGGPETWREKGSVQGGFSTGGGDVRTCAETTDDGTHEMSVEHFQRIVHFAHEFGPTENVHRDPRDGAGANAEQDGAPAGDNTRRRRDGHETGDHALNGADDRRSLEEDHVHGDPGEQAHGGADVGVQHGHPGVGTCRVWISSVEAVPARPQDPSSHQHQGDVTGLGIDAVNVQPRTDPPRAHKPCGAGRQVDHVSPRVVDHPHLVEKASPPNAEGADGVGEGDPQRNEDHPGGEVHAAEKGAGDEDHGDGGEDELEVHHRRLRELLRETGGWKGRLRQLVVDIDRDIRVADQRKHLGAEAHSIGPQDPDDEGGGEGVEGHEGGVDGPFVFHPPGVQYDQTGDALEPDQRPGGQLPRILTWVPPVQRLLEVGRVVGRPAGARACGVIDGGAIWRLHDVDGSGGAERERRTERRVLRWPAVKLYTLTRRTSWPKRARSRLAGEEWTK